MVLCTGIYKAHFAAITGCSPPGYLMKHVVHAWWCPSPFQLYHQKLPWDCLNWVMDKKAGFSNLAKLFTRPESSWYISMWTPGKFDVCFNSGYCRGTATAAISKRLFLSLHQSAFSLCLSIHALSGQSFYGSARPIFWASAVTLIVLTVITLFIEQNSCYW